MLSKTASVVEQAIEEQTEQLEGKLQELFFIKKNFIVTVSLYLDFTMTNADQRKFSNDIKPNSSIVK